VWSRKDAAELSGALSVLSTVFDRQSAIDERSNVNDGGPRMTTSAPSKVITAPEREALEWALDLRVSGLSIAQIASRMNVSLGEAARLVDRVGVVGTSDDHGPFAP